MVLGKREFARLLARMGIAYFDYSQEELADEFQMLGMMCSHGEDL